MGIKLPRKLRIKLWRAKRKIHWKLYSWGIAKNIPGLDPGVLLETEDTFNSVKNKNYGLSIDEIVSCNSYAYLPEGQVIKWEIKEKKNENTL